ncbi:phage head closure protein [Cellulosilyticum sp. ST5]|uniref:phage head closure protein n=1 Tax=Cellulosilyticum sp. ST5 TaxID=3055805 RepID=UPI003977DA28
MDIGRLNKRITFQQLLGKEKDKYGEIIENWGDVITVWAEISPMSGQQFFAAKQINSEITHNVYIRYREGLKPNMRVLFKGRVFEILYIMNIKEENRLLQIYCKELVK